MINPSSVDELSVQESSTDNGLCKILATIFIGTLGKSGKVVFQDSFEYAEFPAVLYERIR